jgi:hypothetical protein
MERLSKAMNTHRQVFLSCAAYSFLLCGCAAKEDVTGVLTVTRPTTLFSDVRGDRQTISGQLAAGDTCAVIGQQSEKVYAYWKVFCRSNQDGFILKDDLDIVLRSRRD